MEIIETLRLKLRELEGELDREMEIRREEFRYSIEKRKVQFEKAVRVRHRALRMGLYRFLRTSRLRHIATAPFIYAMAVPFCLLDAFLFFYQAVCFTAYRIPKVRRREYILIDRHKLEYLNIVEKLNCVYCEYANGLLAYASEIAARTEQYWCPIKHAQRPKAPHSRYYDFLEYGDSADYHRKLEDQREKCRACDGCDFSAKKNSG